MSELRQEFEKWARETGRFGEGVDLFKTWLCEGNPQYCYEDVQFAWSIAQKFYALGQRDGAEKNIGLLRHAAQSTHGFRPEACSACGQIVAALNPSDVVKE